MQLEDVPWSGVGSRLERLLAEHEISKRQLARALAGKDATSDQVEVERVNVRRWAQLGADRMIEARTAERLAAALRRLGVMAEAAMFVRPPLTEEERVDRERERLQRRLRQLDEDAG